MLDDFAGIKSHASEIVSKDEYVSPLDDSNYRYLTKIFLMNTSNLITDYIKSKHKVEMILESLSIDASVVELHTKTSIGFIDSSVKMEKLDVSNEPSIVADSTNYLVFGFNPGNMNIKRIKRFYDSLYYIELALVAIQTKDRQTGQKVLRDDINTLNADYATVELIHMLQPEKYNHSLEPYYRIVTCEGIDILKDITENDIDYEGEVEAEVDCADLCDTVYKRGKYASNQVYTITFKRMNGTFEIEPLSKQMYDILTVDGEKAKIHDYSPYILFLNDEVGDVYLNIIVYLGPGFFDFYKNSNSKDKAPGEAFIECPFYIHEESTWADFNDWLGYVGKMFGGEIPSDLQEEIQELFEFHNFELLNAPEKEETEDFEV